MGGLNVASACEQPENTVTKAPDSEPLPEKRKKRARWTSILICTIAAILVTTFSVVYGTVVEYHPDTTQKNTTIVCYIKKEKLSLPGLFTTALGLFGVVLGTLVDRLSLVNEERHHRNQRYGGSWKKMIKACFSGIKWGPVIALLGLTAVIVVILIIKTNKPWFELSYLVYIFSGIGVGPLIMHLLNLNSQSEVHISTVLEEKGIYIGLAWSYYFNYLKQALPIFGEATSRKFRHPYENIKLTSNKLLLLIPHDGYMKENFNELDRKVEKLFDTGNDQDPFRFPVYRLTVRENEEYYCAIQYIKEPLKTLREMSKLEEIEAIKRKTYEEDVRLLCRTLSEILRKPPDEEFREMCALVPIRADSLESLKNGGLADCIMRGINQSGSTQRDGAPGFVKPAKELRVNIAEPTKPVDKKAKKVKNQRFSSTTYSDKQDVQIDITNNQDDDSSNKKEKEKKLKRNYKKKASDDPERQKIISAENSDNDDKNKTKQTEERPYTQEVGDKNDSGASTSGITTEMTGTDTKRQSDQQDEQSSNINETEL